MIKVLLCRSTVWYKVFDDVLMAVESCDFSHVAIEFEGYIYESVWPYSRKTKKELWLEHYTVIREYEFELDKTLKFEYITFLERYTFKRYSMAQIVAIGLGFINKYFEYYFNKKLLNKDKYLICTEYVVYFLEKYYNYEIPDVDTISLVECENIIKKLRIDYGNIR